MWRRPACKILLKAFNISTTTAQVVQDLIKVLAVLPDATVRRSAVDWEDLKPYSKAGKRKSENISQGDQQTYHLNKPKILLTTERVTWWKFLAVDLSPTFLLFCLQFFIFWPNQSPSKTMYGFYFIWKVLFILEILNCL